MADQQAQEFDKLNPGETPVQDNQFLNYSKLGQLPNITGDLFKELGETVKAGVTGLDDFFKERIRGEATAAVDNERDRTQNWLQGGDAPENLKNSVNANKSLLNNLSTAANQGQISQAYYQMRLDTIARDMRSRYPGYREHIDNVIADLTGGTPANKVITDLFHNATNKSDPESRLSEHLTKEIIDKMPGGGDYLANFRQKNGKNPSNDEMMTVYGKWQTSNISMAVQEKQIKLDQDQGKADEREVGKAAIQHYRFQASQQLQANSSLFSKYSTQLDDAQKTLETTGTLSPEKQSQLMLSANAIEMKLKAQAESTINQFGDQTGQNRKGYLTSLDAENIRKESTAMGEMIRAGLGKDGKILPGVLGAVKEHLTAMSDFNQNELISKYPLMATVAAGRHQLGDNTMAQILLQSQNGKLIAQELQDFNNHIKVTAGSGQKTPAQFIPDIKNRTDDPKQQGLILKEGIDSARSVILNKDTKDVTKTAQSLFKDEFISKINAPKADQQKLYAELSSPEMLSRMEQLRKEGHPELHDQYTNWVTNTGAVLARPEIQTIAAINERNTQAKVEFDPKTLIFSSAPVSGAVPRNMPYDEKQLMDSTVNSLNRLTNPVIAAYKSQGLSNDAIQFKLQEMLQVGNFNLQDITKQEETKAGQKTSGISKASESGREGSFAKARDLPKEQTSQIPAFSEGKINELTAADRQAQAPTYPTRTTDFHVATVNGKHVIIPNMFKTDAEIAKYLSDRDAPSYGISFDTATAAIKAMNTAQKARDEGRYKPH